MLRRLGYTHIEIVTENGVDKLMYRVDAFELTTPSAINPIIPAGLR